MAKPEMQILQIADDISQQNQLLNLQNQILEDIVTGEKAFSELLESLCHCAEALVPEAIASIMMFRDEDRYLSVLAAPSAPQSVVDDLAGLKPCEDSGSCANAVFTGQPTFVSNTRIDPVWRNYQALVNDYNIAACWSYPIFVGDRTAAGSFALSSFEEREPSPFQQNILKVCASLVSLICQRKEQQDKLWEIAHHDALTGLPNRLLLDNQLSHAIQNAQRNGKKLALMFIDLDNFKDINDSYGHAFGDQVLLHAMELIKDCLRKGDIVSRHGGDEFLLVLENLSSKIAVDTIAKKILSSFNSPLTIDGQKISVQFSIGISQYPDDGNSSQELLKNADIAMYQAKASGKNSIQYFEAALAERILKKVMLEQQMREGLERKEFELYYQPQYVADSDVIESLEVLIRWNHPDRGLILPGEFIQVAEQSSLISDIGLFVFRQACQQAVEWVQQGIDIPKISVNFSTSQLTVHCADRLEELLKETSLPASKLEIEITETLLMNRGHKGVEELNKIRSLGVSLAMDDFGTGYSSLSQLKMLPMNKLKIDRSFIKNLETDKDDQTIVKTIIAMGKNLGMRIVAEGVESLGQQQFLLENGCDIIQGYYRNTPLPVDATVSLLKNLESNS